MDMLIPVHQEIVDKRRVKVEKEENYLATLHTRVQQKKTMDKLIGLKVRHHEKLEVLRKQELQEIKTKANTFKAQLNPHKNHDTTEKLEKFFALE